MNYLFNFLFFQPPNAQLTGQQQFLITSGETGNTQCKRFACVQKHWDKTCRSSKSSLIFRSMQLTLFRGLAFCSLLLPRLLGILLRQYNEHLKPYVVDAITDGYLQTLAFSQIKFPDPRWKIRWSLIINTKPVTLECSQLRPVPHFSPGLLCQPHELSVWMSWIGAFWWSTHFSCRQALEM